MFIIFLGVPGAGKGTQADLLQKKLKIPQISTGALFRDEINAQTDLGKQVQYYVDSGGLVPDETTEQIFKQRLSKPDCKNGAILDGFPRTIKQASDLNVILDEIHEKLNYVIYISLSDKEMLERLAGRWTCKANGHIFHEIYNPPKIQGICDFDGSTLYQREDQEETAVKERIQKYKENTEPLIDLYRKKGILIEINGADSIENVHNEVISKLHILI